METLKTVDAETLLTTLWPSTQFIVDRLLPQGLHILAGAPKIGKSWWALWLCLCVSKGESVWDFQTHQGTVLYLCLEDSYSRIQNRLFQLTEDAPSTLHFANVSDSIGTGLENQIEEFVQKHSKTKLIVIDTLQKVRKHTSDSNPYANDYRDIAVLKALADKYHMAILLVHHLRKMNDTDPMNMISGTTGISGATDSNFVLKPDKRGSSQAILYCTGRDIEYQELKLEFDKEHYVWNLLSKSENSQPSVPDPFLMMLSAFLCELNCFDGTATELSRLWEQKTGKQIDPSALSKKLAKYKGDLARAGIHCSSSRTRESRQIHIHCDGSDACDG